MLPEQFAALIGVHETTIYRFINGISFPKTSNLKKIAEATKGSVSANDFIGIERPPPQPIGRPRKVNPEQKTEGSDNAAS